MMTRTKRALIATSVAMLVGVGAAAAATGDLTPQGCIDDVGNPAGCSGTPQEGLNNPERVAVSPDGRSVYVVANDDRALVHFDRNPATGALTGIGCINDVGGGAPCGSTAAGLGEVRDVAVSPDGKSVYAVSGETGVNTLVRFDRDTTEPDVGGLTAQGCLADVGLGATCGGPEQEGLEGARSVAVSPDNRSIYVASNGDDAIVQVGRSTIDGSMTPQGCVEDPPSDAGCGATQEGLDGAIGVAVSADNKSVYVASSADDAVVRLDRKPDDPGIGNLTPQGCVEDPPSDVGCAATQQGLDFARAVATSPDNNSVYVTSETDGAVVRLDRNTTSGALTPQGCFGFPAGCTNTSPVMGNVRGLAVSPDGRTVYAAAFNNASIFNFDREPATGALTFRNCVADVGVVGCATNAQGLSNVHGIAVSPDSASVYAVGSGDDAVVRFFREVTTGGGGGSTPPVEPPVEPPPEPEPDPPVDPSQVRISVPGRILGTQVDIFAPVPGTITIEQRPGQNRVQLAERAKTKKLLKPSSVTAEEAGEVTLKLRLTKTGKNIFKKKGKLKLRVVVTFAPTTGDPQTQNATLKLKKKGK